MKARSILKLGTEILTGKKGFKLGLQKTVEWFKNKNNLSMYNSEIFNQ